MIKHFIGLYSFLFSFLVSFGAGPDWSYRVVDVSPSMISPYPVGFEWDQVTGSDGAGGYNWDWLFMNGDGTGDLYVPPFDGSSDYWLHFSGDFDGGVFSDVNLPWDWIEIRRVCHGGISGRVILGASGVSNVLVKAWSDQGFYMQPCGPSDPVYSGRDGVFVIPELAPGNYMLSASFVGSSASFDVGFPNVVAVGSSFVSNVICVVDRPCEFKGSLEPARYAPPAEGVRVRVWKRSKDYSYSMQWQYGNYDAFNPQLKCWSWVSVLNRDGAYWQAMEGVEPLYTDGSGSFSVSSLPAGDYMVSFDDASGFYNPAEFSVVLPRDNGRRFSLEAVSWDWSSHIPQGDIWVLGCTASDSDGVYMSAGNFDPSMFYYIFMGPSVASVVGPDRWNYHVGTYYWMSGVRDFWYEKPSWPSCFFSIEGFPAD